MGLWFSNGTFRIPLEYQNFPVEILRSYEKLIFPWENKSQLKFKLSRGKLSYSDGCIMYRRMSEYRSIP